MLVNYNLFSCDLLFFQHRPGQYKLGKHDFIIPYWVGADMPLPFSGTGKSLKNELRSIRKNKLSYAVTSDPIDIENFIDSMWAPTMKKRYPEKDIATTRSEWKKHVCELLFIKDGKEAIAGALLRYDHEGPYFWRTGLKNGDLSLWSKGVIGATYYFAAEYLYAKGYTSMDVGFSRSFLNDGVMQFKRKWGIQLRMFRKQSYLALRVLRKTVPVRSFFLHNPFFFVSRDSLYAAVFFDENHEPKRIPAQYRFQGLEGFHVYDVMDLSLLHEE